ncbi:outer membrane lipid asymmetry maintenance protein MlaD [Nitrospira sp. Kam-Ns4a]
MERAKLELVVGLFVLVGLACLGYLSIKLGKLELVGGHYYRLEAEFTSASGLKPGATVEMAGVEIGRVQGITLRDERALVALAIKEGVKVHSDTFATIKTRGIIGEKYVSLSPGGGGDLLKDGDTIRDTEAGLDLEELISQFIHGDVGKSK